MSKNKSSKYVNYNYTEKLAFHLMRASGAIKGTPAQRAYSSSWIKGSDLVMNNSLQSNVAKTKGFNAGMKSAAKELK